MSGSELHSEPKEGVFDDSAAESNDSHQTHSDDSDVDLSSSDDSSNSTPNTPAQPGIKSIFCTKVTNGGIFSSSSYMALNAKTGKLYYFFRDNFLRQTLDSSTNYIHDHKSTDYLRVRSNNYGIQMTDIRYEYRVRCRRSSSVLTVSWQEQREETTLQFKEVFDLHTTLILGCHEWLKAFKPAYLSTATGPIKEVKPPQDEAGIKTSDPKYFRPTQFGISTDVPIRSLSKDFIWETHAVAGTLCKTRYVINGRGENGSDSNGRASNHCNGRPGENGRSAKPFEIVIHCDDSRNLHVSGALDHVFELGENEVVEVDCSGGNGGRGQDGGDGRGNNIQTDGGDGGDGGGNGGVIVIKAQSLSDFAYVVPNVTCGWGGTGGSFGWEGKSESSTTFSSFKHG
ncbi:hypothetical protein GEMRC1_010973 [Eukaryota sp. GEM-RC1]